MIPLLPAVPWALPIGNLMTPQSLQGQDLDSVLTGELHRRRRISRVTALESIWAPEARGAPLVPANLF